MLDVMDVTQKVGMNKIVTRGDLVDWCHPVLAIAYILSHYKPVNECQGLGGGSRNNLEARGRQLCG